MSINMSLTDAFTAVFKQSPMPIQLEVERTLNSSNGLADSSHHQLGKLFEKTINCNTQHEKSVSSFVLPSKPCQLFSWIIKPVPNTVGVCVEGKKSLDDEGYWHSGLVVKRLSSAVIETNSGSRYELIGDIVFLDALDADIPEPLAESFLKGFPENWESLINKYLTSNTSTISNHSIAAKSPTDALLEITDLVSQQSTDRNYQNNQNQIPTREYITKDSHQTDHQTSNTSWHENTQKSNMVLESLQNNQNRYINRQNGHLINDENIEISSHGQSSEKNQQQFISEKQYISKINSPTGKYEHQSILQENAQNVVVQNHNIDIPTQNIVVPTENGSRILNQVANINDEEMTEICMGGDISNSDSLLSKTVLGKQLGKMEKPTIRSQKSESAKTKKTQNMHVPSLTETDDTEDSYTQDRTPYSHRQKRRIVSDDESETNDSASSTTDSKSDSRQRKRAKVDKRQTRSSSKSDTLVTLSSAEESESNKQVGNKRNKKKNSNNIGGKKEKSMNNSGTGSASNSQRTNVQNSESRVFSLSDWIIRPMKKLRCVLVEGKRKGVEEYWRSSSIAERKDAKTVVTNSGSVYKLVGNIEKLDAIEAGFHPALVKSFTRGFPKNWQKLIEMHFNGEFVEDEFNEKPKPKKNGIDKSIEESILNETMVGTPGGQLIDLTQIKHTRSGRIVKPALASWMGQRVQYDPHSGKMKVVYNTKFAETVFTKEAIQLSAKTMRSKFSKKKSTPNESLTSSQHSEKHSDRKEYDALSEKVMSVLKTAKEKRSERKRSEKRDTCYNTATSRIHMRSRESRKQSTDEEMTEYKSEALPKITRGRQKKEKKVTNTTKKSVVSRLNSDYETDSVTGSESIKKKKSKVILKNDQSNSDSSGSDEIVFKEPVKSSKSKKKQTSKARVKNLEEKTASSSGEAFDIWGLLEKKRLDNALSIIPPNDSHVWKRLANAVGTRTEEECKEYVKSEKKYAEFLSRIKPEKEIKLVEITAKKGTMKRRQQIKALLEQKLDANEDEFDVTEATPYRARTKKIPQVDVDDDELFGGGDFPITPASQAYRTPTFKHCLQMFSAKKTPSNVHAVSSPVNNTVRKKNAEKVVHNYLKRRKQDRANPSKKVSAPVNNKPRTLFRPGKVDGSIFDIDDHKTDDEDEDEEKDHYFSEESFDD